MRVWYFLVLVLLACRRTSSNSLSASGTAGSARYFSTVPICRSGMSIPNCSRICRRSAAPWVVLRTAPPVMSWACCFKLTWALATASIAARARPRSIDTPRSLIVWSSSHNARSVSVLFTDGMRRMHSRIATMSLAA